MLTAKGIDQFRRKLGAGEVPGYHVVLGSGFGAALHRVCQASGDRWVLGESFGFEEIPGIPRSTVPDHAGKFQLCELARGGRPSGKRVLFQLGRLHGYEGHQAREAVSPVMAGRLSGIERFLLTNAAGGLDPRHCLGDVMLILDHVNMTGQNPLSGENPSGLDGKPLGPRFPDMGGLYEPEWRPGMKAAMEKSGLRAHEGIYLGLLGPSFETHAEVELFARWGVQAVGMSTVWEAIALKHSGARLAGLSLISNAAAGMGDGAPLDHERIVEACRSAAERIVRGILLWLEERVGLGEF